MKMTLKYHVIAAALVACAYLPVHAADAASAAAPGVTRTEAKEMKAQSEGAYKARSKVAEANEALGKADCEAMTGSARRACKKEAKAVAKAQKARAKTIHEAEEQQIKASKK